MGMFKIIKQKPGLNIQEKDWSDPVLAVNHAQIFRTKHKIVLSSAVSIPMIPNLYAGYMDIKDRQGRSRSLHECIGLNDTAQGKWVNTGPEVCPAGQVWLIYAILEPGALAGMRDYYAIRKVLSVKIRSSTECFIYKAHGYDCLYHPPIIDEPHYYQSELI